MQGSALETDKDTLIKHQAKEIQVLKNIISELKRDKFGSKSERVLEDPNQQLIFNEFEAHAPSAGELIEKEVITYTRKKGRSKSKRFPEDLEREEQIIDLPEDQKTCPHDGARLKEIGEEISEKLKTIPARHIVSVIRRKKFACPQCDEHIVQAKQPSILPGTIATPELLSFIVFSKFFQSLPLYRLEEFYKLSSIELKRGTMARWMVQISEKLMPIWNLLEEKAMGSSYMAIDATTVQVLKEEGRRAQLKSSMWVRGSPEQGIVLFDYDVSGAGKVAKKLMTDFKGALQADAHRGYGELEKKNLLLLGCMMHARRRFFKAWVLGKKKEGIASQGLRLVGEIYKKEESYKTKKLTPEQRKEQRLTEVAPKLKEFKKWCRKQLTRVAKSTPTGNALSYVINEYTELSAFLEDGRYEIDNGWVERQIKRFAIGRKNWMFADTPEGANASALLYSLTLTAKLNGKDPYKAMTELLSKLPFAKTLEDFEGLTQILLSPYDPNSCLKKEGALIH